MTVLIEGNRPVMSSYNGSSSSTLRSALFNSTKVAIVVFAALFLLKIIVITVMETTTQMIRAAARTPIDIGYATGVSAFELCLPSVSVVSEL